MTKKTTVGGVQWELGEARKEIIAAQRVNDPEAETQGWMRLCEALVNAAGSGAARVLAPMLAELREAREAVMAARAERKTDVIVSEHNQSMLIDQATVMQGAQGRTDARLGIVEMRMSELERILNEFALARVVSIADVALLGAQLELASDRITHLEEQASPLDARVTALEAPAEP